MELRCTSKCKLNQTSLEELSSQWNSVNVCSRRWLTVAVDLYQNPSKSNETREFHIRSLKE